MNEYETEDQQVEAVKKWFKENGSSLVVGVLVGASALFGWRYYNDHLHVHALQASNIYMQLMQSTILDKVDDTTLEINNRLINEYSDTPYASLSSLALAKVEYEKGNHDAAIAQLELAVKNATDEILKHTANLRLASIHIEQKQFDQAATLLKLPHDPAFAAKYEEMRGDMYVAKGARDEARAAYDKAIELYGAGASRILQLKRQSLGSANTSDDNNSASAISLSEWPHAS